MDYNDLYKQDFDDDPARPGPVLPKDKNQKQLSSRLAMVQKLEEASQRTFMASLSLEEWDEAGDWFLERFEELVKKMKDARKVRRDESKQLEAEVLKRHEQVERKKRSFDEALASMKNSGQGLLRSGTPKRAKK
jgi:predicted ATPase